MVDRSSKQERLFSEKADTDGESATNDGEASAQSTKGKRRKNWLPDGKEGNLSPANGELIRTDPQTGLVQQIRTFGEKGKPLKDINFGHDHGAGDPHIHDWCYPSCRAPIPERQPGRPPRQGEIP